jgi:hypothetical protein
MSLPQERTVSHRFTPSVLLSRDNQEILRPMTDQKKRYRGLDMLMSFLCSKTWESVEVKSKRRQMLFRAKTSAPLSNALELIQKYRLVQDLDLNLSMKLVMTLALQNLYQAL